MNLWTNPISEKTSERTATKGMEMQDIRDSKVGTVWAPTIRMRNVLPTDHTHPSVTVSPADAIAVKVALVLAFMYVFLLAPFASTVSALFVTPVGHAVASLVCQWLFVPFVIWVAKRAGLGDDLALRIPRVNGCSLVMIGVLLGLAVRPLFHWHASVAFSLTGQACLVATMCFVGTVEELLFRGVVKEGLARVMPSGHAVIASSALFALSHVPVCLMTNPRRLLSTLSFAFVFGIITCVAKDATESNVPGIACHCVYDSLIALMG